MRKIKFLLAALMVVGAFWCLVGNGTEVRAEGGSSSAPNIVITKTNSSAPTTVDLSNTELKTLDFSYSIVPERVGNYQVYVGVEKATLTGEKNPTDANAQIKPLSSAPTIGANEWGYRTSGLTTSANPTPTGNYAVPKQVSGKYYGDKINEVGVTDDKATVSGGKTTYLTIQVAAQGSPTLPADTYKGKIILSVVATPKTTVTMQSMSSIDECPETASAETALEDERDGNTYLVAKLKNNSAGTEYKCWMLQNLALGGDKEIKLTSADSNVTSDFTLPASSTITGDYNTPQIYKGSHKNGTQDNSTDNTGAYYNWSAAVATNNTSSITTRYQNVPTSICPKGWTLPSAYGANSGAGISSSTGQFQTLYNAYGNKTAFDAAWKPGFPGVYYSGSQNNGGSYSYWWSSTVYSSNYAYILNENGSNVYPADYNSRSNGFSVRCVFAG